MPATLNKKNEILHDVDLPRLFKGYVADLKIGAGNQAKGRCCFHEDKNPSFSVNLQTGLYNCFSCGASGDSISFVMEAEGLDFPGALEYLQKFSANGGQAHGHLKPTLVATFEYNDANGKLLYWKERFEPGFNGNQKSFVFKHLENGKYVKGRGCEPILYRMSDLKKGAIYITEGEAQADLLTSWEFVATSLDTGSESKWRAEYTEILRGSKEIIILPDNDKPGQAYAERIALELCDKVDLIKIVKLPGLEAKGDVLNWVKIPGNDRLELKGIVNKADSWRPTHTGSFTRLGDLLTEPEAQVNYVVENFLPSSGFAILTAKPKVGKTTLAQNLAFSVARGDLFLGMEVNEGPVIYIALEQKRSEIKKHFKLMGVSGKEPIFIHTAGTSDNLMTEIVGQITAINPVLVIVDPLFRLIKVKDGNCYAQMTQALDPLIRIARDYNVTILCTHHSPKGERNPEDSVLGSQAIFGAVDTLIILKKDQSGTRSIQTIQRYDTDLPETILALDPRTGIITTSGFREDFLLNAVQKEILEFLSTQEEPVIEATINDQVKGRIARQRKALRILVNEGSISRIGMGGKGNPYHYSCSSKNTCSDQKPKYGNKQIDEIDKKNDSNQNACSLVPMYYREQTKKKNENAVNSYSANDKNENACSHFPLTKEHEKANLGTSKSEGFHVAKVNDNIPEIEFIEVLGNVQST